MYTLTRKLSVVCLTVVLSFLVYGCGGSSKQALITDVSTDMVTAGLMPDPGTYTIGPGGTATAGDVTFACPEEGSACEVTVADDGTVTSAGGMAMAMDSASATARLAAEAAQMTAETERDAANAAAMTAETERDAANAAAMTAETERDAANAAAMTAETARDAANAAAMTAETARDAAVAAQMTAETARDAANAAAMLSETERDAANARAMAAETARDAANAAQMTAETARDAANARAMTAETERDAANARAMTAETARDAANARAMTAETERDAAVVAQMTAETERDAAVARAVLLETVNPIVVALATGYGTVTPGVYEIEPGGTSTAPGDDVTFTCPDEGSLCLVIVTVNEDGVASYTSLGGVATGANSMSVMNTRMAAALHSPGNTDLNTGTAPAVTVTRKTVVSGGETEITLVPDGESDAQAAVEYSIGPVDSGHEIDNWSGQTMSRSDEDELPTPQEATVYMNIEPATEQKLKLGDADATTPVAPPAPSQDNLYVLDPGEDVDAINMDVMDMDTFRATYNGIPGMFTCADADICENNDIAVTTVTGGQMNISNSFTAGGWTFESDNFVETEATQDADYMYFGYWLQSPEDPGAETVEYMFAAFSGGAADNNFVLTGGLLDAQDEALTATYEGGAAGRYVTRKLRIDAEGVDPQSPGYHGRFTATATLTANFGTHEDTNADAEAGTAATHNTIGGTITDFMDGATNLGFKVTLERTGITTGGITDGTAMATFGETATSTAANGTGDWSGQFFGPSADTSDEVMEDPDTHLPSGVAGKFNANSTYANVVGAFAAD